MRKILFFQLKNLFIIKMEDGSLEELKIIAKNRGIKGCSKLSKA
jgi:hypothetical protein